VKALRSANLERNHPHHLKPTVVTALAQGNGIEPNHEASVNGFLLGGIPWSDKLILRKGESHD
jgi:hypothetical protein